KEAPETSRRAWVKAVREEAEKRNFSWAYWELASGFGIYNQIEYLCKNNLAHLESFLQSAD
ncbi:hypothetical protein D1N57_20730, partial [Clostridioides difficile]